VHGSKDRWMDGWMDEWMNGWWKLLALSLLENGAIPSPITLGLLRRFEMN